MSKERTPRKPKKTDKKLDEALKNGKKIIHRRSTNGKKKKA